MPPDTVSVRGFLVHVFHNAHGSGKPVFAVGRLENGQTFGLVDRNFRPAFYIRCADLDSTKALTSGQAMVRSCDLSTMDGETVFRLECHRPDAARRLAGVLRDAGIRTYQADLRFEYQYRIERGLRGSVRLSGLWQTGRTVDRVYIEPHLQPCSWVPKLAVLVMIIHTQPQSGLVASVCLAGNGPLPRHRTEEVHLLGQAHTGSGARIHGYPDEASLLHGLIGAIQRLDPDVLSGWNLVENHLRVLQLRCQQHGIRLCLGRIRHDASYSTGQSRGSSGRLTVYGRQILDAVHLLRFTQQHHDDQQPQFSVLKPAASSRKLYPGNASNLPATSGRTSVPDLRGTAEFGLQEARSVLGLLIQDNLLGLTLRRSLQTGLPLEHAWGSIAAFDMLYTGELHRRGMVPPSIGVDRRFVQRPANGLVLSPRAGLRRHVFVFAFRNFHPSLMRTFNLDPLAHVRGRQGACRVLLAPNSEPLSRETGILPELLTRLCASRARAEASGDLAASRADSKLLNSVYDVLTTDACRYADDTLTSAIAGFGQQVLKQSRQLLQDSGQQVIHIDTHSLVVNGGVKQNLSPENAYAHGASLCRWINQRLTAWVRQSYGVESCLNLELQRYYARFLLPPSRTGQRTRLKGYAGLRIHPNGEEELEIAGMEVIRRDWTRLAEQLHRDLLHLIFHHASIAAVEKRVAHCLRALRAGECDADLAYCKAPAKPLEWHTGSAPPHPTGAPLPPGPSDLEHYIQTLAGPQPVDQRTAPIDYEHYVRNQVTPVVRTLTQVVPLDAEAMLRGSASLFSQTPLA